MTTGKCHCCMYIELRIGTHSVGVRRIMHRKADAYQVTNIFLVS